LPGPVLPGYEKRFPPSPHRNKVNKKLPLPNDKGFEVFYHTFHLGAPPPFDPDDALSAVMARPCHQCKQRGWTEFVLLAVPSPEGKPSPLLVSVEEGGRGVRELSSAEFEASKIATYHLHGRAFYGLRNMLQALRIGTPVPPIVTVPAFSKAGLPVGRPALEPVGHLGYPPPGSEGAYTVTMARACERCGGKGWTEYVIRVERGLGGKVVFLRTCEYLRGLPSLVCEEMTSEEIGESERATIWLNPRAARALEALSRRIREQRRDTWPQSPLP
jgi:hypothetical protein